MITVLTIQILLVALFVGAAIWNKRELPDSISAIVYELKKPYQFLWTVAIWIISFLFVYPMMVIMAGTLQFVGFLTIVCLLFTGAMPLIPGSHNTAHNVLGVSAGILSQICVLIICPYWLLMWMLFLIISIDAWFAVKERFYDHKACIIAEFICYVSLVGALLTHNY